MSLECISFDNRFITAHVRLWLRHGWDASRACTHEALAFDGTNLEPLGGTSSGEGRSRSAFRTMAVCRQIYLRAVTLLSYSRSSGAYLSSEDLLACRIQGLALLTQLRDVFQGVASDGETESRGWYFSVDAFGSPANSRKDLYTHAFVILATSVAFQAFREDWILELARRAVKVTERLFSLKDCPWFAASLDMTGRAVDQRCVQNPHMHLFEALMAFALVSGHPCDYDRVHNLADLFPRLLHPHAHMVVEFMTEEGRPEGGNAALIEPGHQFEWAWLLYVYAERFCPEPSESHIWRARARDVFRCGMEWGLDREHGGVFNALEASGRILDDNKRIWPVTEGIKAASVLRPEKVSLFLDLLQARYLRSGGRWVETCDRALQPVEGALKATTGYHLMTAWQEIPSHRHHMGVYALLCADVPEACPVSLV